ncbi:serine/threonine-protein kinase [Actinacidiphila bryophytorum]|uniref:Non-specific serine/threonine protein kinase n=1 Tax=Actinacidiphila bryophytorum TaxID=1436133 RepID=A0A9W4DY20_9ACTN|nr:serine/threonine-protein kinase [Actinacidiphila bryophytorum]MBM9439020.1 serine/threonine protein kinase [Actinacidiphila bryophytorum]MBN6545901.1 serine/threonine protein kinase [Actinacidiphila bryophytorum]CAG7597479.1 Non-specific serine/threonine protein kinase [Actinacidiphila bryophytorum]
MSGAGSSEVFQPLEADDPASVGTYRIAAKLGAGGMGKVYLSHTPAGRPVAIKVIRPEFAEDPEFRRRFKQEVQAAQRVQGLYTAPVIDSDADGARPWLATAFVPGPTLSSAVSGHGPLPVPTVLLLVAGIAEALEAVHGAGLVHRDLKPSNVLLASDGPRVIDFGIARAADATALTGSGVTIGTPAFMSPEQAAGREITPATDVFALGQVAAYAALGSPAYGDGPSHAVLYRIVHEEPDLATLPAELRPLVSRCLAKEPGERPSLAEVVRLCQAASQQTELRRPEQWLPGALAAEIPARHAAPGSPAGTPAPAAAAPQTPPPPVTRPDVAQPAQPPTPPPAQPPAQPATQPAAAAQQTPPPAAQPPVHPPTQPASTPPQGQPQVQPVQPPYAQQPPVQQPPVQQQQPAQHPAYGYPQQHQQQGFGAPPAMQQHAMHQPPPGPQQPKRKTKRNVLLASVAALVLIAGAVAGTLALTGGKDDPEAKGTTPPVTSGAPVDNPTDAPTSDAPTSEAPTSAAPPSPESHPGIQLADGYHLVLGDPDLKPLHGMDEDMYYYCSSMENECHFATDFTKFVLLDKGEEGSLDTCLKDTRYTTEIVLARLSTGSQFCATTDSTVALITFQRASKSTEASTYVVIDVTIWRNAIPPSNDE